MLLMRTITFLRIVLMLLMIMLLILSLVALMLVVVGTTLGLVFGRTLFQVQVR